MASIEALERQFDIDIDELLKGKKHTESEIQERIKYIQETYGVNDIKRVCCFGRVSTKHDEQEMSLYTQRTMFHNYIEHVEKDGYIIVEEIYDRKSATLASRRPKFLNMIERAKRGEFNILLFKDSKRFSRNAEDFLVLIEELKRLDIFVVFISEGINSKDADRMTLTMLGMISESHSNGLHKSVNSAMLVNMQRDEGRFTARTYGYDKPVVNDSRVVSINKKEAAIVKEVFVRLANLEGVYSIVDDFRERRIYTKYNNEFNANAIYRMARNKKYIGIIEMHKDTREDVRAERKKLDKSEWIIRKREDIRIIDDDLFYKVQDILDSRKPNTDTDKFKTIRSRAFTGLIRCDCCGKNLIRVQGGHKPKGYYTYFQCISSRDRKKVANVVECDNTKTFRESTLFDVFKVYFAELLKQQDNIEKLIEQRINIIIKKYIAENSNNLVSENEINELKNKLKRATELYIDGMITKDKIEDLRGQLQSLEKSTKVEKLVDLESIDTKAFCKKFFSNIDCLVQNGLNADSIDGYKFNSLFESITANKEGELSIIFKIDDSCLNDINCGGCDANNNQDNMVDLGGLIDWNLVNKEMNSIRTSTPENLRFYRLNKRYRTLGIDWFDKIYIKI